MEFVGMATIKEVVLKHHKKDDGTYNIKYRLTHNRKITYIKHELFCRGKAIKKRLYYKRQVFTFSGLDRYRKIPGKVDRARKITDAFRC